MPECTLEDPAPRIGHPVECRPPVLPSRSHYSIALGWSTGLVDDPTALFGVLRIAHGTAIRHGGDSECASSTPFAR